MNKEDWKLTPACIRGTLSGFFVGGIAGAGAAVASFVSYGMEKKARSTVTSWARAPSRVWRALNPPTTLQRAAP